MPITLTGNTRYRPLLVPHMFKKDEVLLVLQVEMDQTTAGGNFEPGFHWRDARIEDITLVKETK